LIEYTLNREPDAIGKNPHTLNTRLWERTQGTLTDLVDWAYVQGRTFAPGLFDLSPLRPDEVTPRTAERWIGADIIVVDIDDAPGWTYEEVIGLEFNKKYLAAAFPSSRYCSDYIKLHLVYLLNSRMSQPIQYKEVGRYIASQLEVKVDTSTLTPNQPIYGTVYTEPSMIGTERTLEDDLVYINLDAELILPHEALAARLAEGVYQPSVPSPNLLSPDETLNKRVKAHYEATFETRTRVTLEALSYALTPEWGELSRDERMTLIMSAYAGSNDEEVRDAFLEYSSPRWDSSSQKMNLSGWWMTHKPKPNGLTVATLFYLARQNGWLRYSSVELTGFTEIYSEEVGDWLTELDPIPARMLLRSGTGTGKTLGAIRLLKKLGTPKSIFFAPSVKLCMALSASLLKCGVENTLYIEKNRTKDSDTLKSAQVLVTTLQTFATKVLNQVDISSYEYVVIDESDELFSSFVRSGVGAKIANASHVTRAQASSGMEALSKLCKLSKYVLCFDGTATNLSRYLLEALSDTPISIYANTYVRDKAPVTLAPDLNSIRDLAFNSVKSGAKVVIATDTKDEAELIEETLILGGAASKDETLRITGDTIYDKRVNEFFGDVEAGAKAYRVIIYNSAMGSGVSITETVPDVLIFIGTYLSPRKLIQMLNRYRIQSKVYAYIAPRESLYGDTVDTKYKRLNAAIQRETELSGLRLKERVKLSTIVTHAALLSANDEFDQLRSVKDFMVRLLTEDGRDVYHLRRLNLSVSVTNALDEARDYLTALDERVLNEWRSVPPLGRDSAIPEGYNGETIAKGVLHNTIVKEVPDYETKAENLNLSDDELALAVLKFRKYKWTLDKFLKPESLLTFASKELYDSRRELVTLKLYMARVELLSLVGYIIPDTSKTYQVDNLLGVDKFLAEVGSRRSVYDMVASSHLNYESVLEREDDINEAALKLAGGIVKSIGLSLKRKNGKRKGGESRVREVYVEGLDSLKLYLTLRGECVKDIQFEPIKFEKFSNDVKAVSKRFSSMSSENQNQILQTLQTLENVTLEDALNLLDSRSF
jgi:hypothetical protein